MSWREGGINSERQKINDKYNSKSACHYMLRLKRFKHRYRCTHKEHPYFPGTNSQNRSDYPMCYINCIGVNSEKIKELERAPEIKAENSFMNKITAECIGIDKKCSDLGGAK